jgi:lysophospholipase L1-like esterase
VHSLALEELRAAWLALGLLLALTLRSTQPIPLALGLVPWLTGALLLGLRRSRSAFPAAAARLTGSTGARMSLLVVGVLVTLVAVLTNLYCALLVIAWAGAASLLLALALGEKPLVAALQGAAMLGATLAVICTLLEGVLHLPTLQERFGRPPQVEVEVWNQRYDRVARDNVFGFRTVHQSVPRTPGVRRILAMGDSFTWGQYVASTDSIWPSRLEAELRRSAPDRPTEVINISQLGWSMADEVRALERIGWQFAPDRLVLQFYLNDHNPVQEDPDVMHRLGKPPEILKGGLLQVSALAYWLRVKYWQTVGQAALRENALGNYEDGSAGWRRVSGGLHRIAEQARSRGIPVTLLLFPALAPGRWTAESYQFRAVYRKVARAALAEGIQVLDLTPEFAAEGGNWRRWWATPYDRHPSAAAHAIAARAVARYLAEQGW